MSRALARIAAEEALQPLAIEAAASNDTSDERPRRRHDSGTLAAVDAPICIQVGAPRG